MNPADGNSRRLAVIYLSERGELLAVKLRATWIEQGETVDCYHAGKQSDLSMSGITLAGGSLTQLMASLWKRYDGFVMIMAVGIVVRVIAPLLQSKWRDPGVVVVDEAGTFAVSLLSGHWGLANQLACEVASLLGATAVVTTATDVQHKPAVDLLARHCGFIPLPANGVKLVSSALLRDEPVHLYSEWDLTALASELQGILILPWQGLANLQGNTCKQNIVGCVGDPVTIWVTSRVLDNMPPNGLQLCPCSLVAGVGCVRGITCQEILDALSEALRRAGRRIEGLKALVSHQVKADEVGLREAADKLGLPLQFYDNEQLEQVLQEHPGLEDDPFVRAQLGVGGVCETAAMAAMPQGDLVLIKTRLGKVTVALVEASSLWSESGQEIRKI